MFSFFKKDTKKDKNNEKKESLKILKLIICGESCVGKTSILDRYFGKNFEEKLIGQIGKIFILNTIYRNGFKNKRN